MAYGLYIKPEYGKYPKVKSLDDRFDKNFILKKEYRELPNGSEGDRPAAGLDRVLPIKILWKDSAGRMAPDFDQTPAINISGKAKDIIEGIEPRVHRFVPVEYLYSKGATETRFWLHVGNKIDSVNGEHSNMSFYMGGWYSARDLMHLNIPLPDYINVDAPSRLVFNREATAPYHMWWDQYLGRGAIFISDVLGGRFKAERITGLRLDESVAKCV
jgi:hypothetical protein